MQQYIDFMLNNWLLFVALIVIVGLLVMTTVRSRLLGFIELKPIEAVELMNRDEPRLLDVRSQSDYQAGHIQAAVHIPAAELEARLDEMESWREQPVLVYCRTGQDSAKAAGLLKRQGFTRVHKLDGGMMAWQTANLPVVSGTK